MSFQGVAPLVSPSELTYFPGDVNAGYSFTVSAGLFVTTNAFSTYTSLFSVNASGPETDNVYVGWDAGNASGSATRIMVGFVLDATHYLVCSPSGIGGNLVAAQFVYNNGGGQNFQNVTVSPPIPYNTASAFLTFFMAISGTVATAYAINQTTGLLTTLGSFDVSATISAAQLQTFSAGGYFDGFGSTSVSVKNWKWGPNSDLAAKTVPDVVGETQAQAATDITAADLIVGTVTFSPSSPIGFVLSQTPVPGTLANFGDPVNIVVSSGLLKSVYGKFVGSPVFPPTLLIDAKGIKPRIYMPKENVTVKT